jgi:DNA-3-methyladenine glycosylase I
MGRPCYPAGLGPRRDHRRTRHFPVGSIASLSEKVVASKRPASSGRPLEKARCGWVPAGDAEYTRYHDEEWGRPVHDDRRLFEMLTLEGAQAGLSWSTILRKRSAYRKAFAGFDPGKVARFDARRRAALMQDSGIVRNRLKIDSTVTNAQAFLAVQQEFGSFGRYLWDWVGGHPVINGWRSRSQVPARSDLSDRISRDLKKRGFRFVGSTIIYAYLQAVGVVNDHTAGCYLYCARPAAGRVAHKPSRS